MSNLGDEPGDTVLTLQGSWHYYASHQGFEAGSVIQQARLGFKGLPPERLEHFFKTLMDGVSARSAVKDLAERSGLSISVVQKILETLQEKHALKSLRRSELEEDPNSLYDRQIRFFNAFETEEISGREFNGRLQACKVLIVGLGGYGTWLAQLCARIGIRHIVGVDPDRVELSNLHRQILYTRDDIGKPKLESCRQALTRVDEAVSFEGHATWISCADDLLPYLPGVDLVFNSFGYLPVSGNPVVEHIAEACLRAKVPCLHFSGSWIGPLTLPGRTACYWCLQSKTGLAEVVAASQPMRGRRFTPAFAPRMAMTSSLAVWEASRFLSGIDTPVVLENIIILDLFRYHQHSLIPLELNKACPACQGLQQGAEAMKRVWE